MRAHQNQEGDTDIPFAVTVHLFLAKNTMSLFRTTKQRYTGGFYASLRYIERKSAIGTTKPRGYRYTVCCHGVPLSGKKYDVALQNCRKVYRWIFRQFTIHWTKLSYWGHSKTKREIPIYRLLSRYTSFWQKYDVAFYFYWVFQDVRVF